MKKLLSVTLVFVLILGVFMPVTSYAGDVHITIGGQRVNFSSQTPIIRDGRTLVPARDVFESMGFDVSWDAASRSAVLIGNGHVVNITIDSNVFTVNGANHTFDVPARIIDGNLMLPVRAVLESMGYSVGWDNATRTVAVTSEIVSAPVPMVQEIQESASEPTPAPVSMATPAVAAGTSETVFVSTIQEVKSAINAGAAVIEMTHDIIAFAGTGDWDDYDFDPDYVLENYVITIPESRQVTLRGNFEISHYGWEIDGHLIWDGPRYRGVAAFSKYTTAIRGQLTILDGFYDFFGISDWGNVRIYRGSPSLLDLQIMIDEDGWGWLPPLENINIFDN